MVRRVDFNAQLNGGELKCLQKVLSEGKAIHHPFNANGL